MSERNLADANKKGESAPQIVECISNIETIRPKRIRPAPSSVNVNGTTFCPFSLKLIIATPNNIPAKEEIDTDANEDPSARGTFACLSKLIMAAIVNMEPGFGGYVISFAAGTFPSLKLNCR
jgi:hypothetical protein